MLHHYILRPQADQLRAVGLFFDDGLHDEITKGSALNAVNTEGYRNDEFKAIHIIADAVVLPDMTTHTLLFQNAVLEYSLDSLAHIVAENDNVLLICKKEDSSALVRKYVNEVQMKKGDEFV